MLAWIVCCDLCPPLPRSRAIPNRLHSTTIPAQLTAQTAKHPLAIISFSSLCGLTVLLKQSIQEHFFSQREDKQNVAKTTKSLKFWNRKKEIRDWLLFSSTDNVFLYRFLAQFSRIQCLHNLHESYKLKMRKTSKSYLSN